MITPMSESPFVKLQHANDWGFEYLAYKALDDRGMASARRAIEFKEGQEIEVQWPDGTVTVEKIVPRSKHETVNDMGHSYNVDSTLPGIMGSCHGVSVWICLDQVSVRADAFSGAP